MTTPTPPPADGATQSRHPWRATARTVAAGIVAAVPVLIDVLLGLHLDGTVVGGTSLAVLGGATRVLAMPAVDNWLTDYLPWLAARPRSAQ